MGPILGPRGLRGIQVHEFTIRLTRILTRVPLQRLFVDGVLPRRGERKGGIGLPIIENFGVNARSGTSSPAVHTGGLKGGDRGVDFENQTQAVLSAFGAGM
jgi:hypothetical protein